jgi:hypothetical protein
VNTPSIVEPSVVVNTQSIVEPDPEELDTVIPIDVNRESIITHTIPPKKVTKKAKSKKK